MCRDFFRVFSDAIRRMLSHAPYCCIEGRDGMTPFGINVFLMLAA